jgi:N-acylethanolamine-hydrolysing acid amidase
VQLLQEVKKMVPPEVVSLASVIGNDVDRYMPFPYGLEMVGVAEAVSGVSVGDVVLGNMLYEVTAFSHSKWGAGGRGQPKMCTSIVAEAINGTIYHGRNLDYSFTNVLSDMTVIIDFQEGGKTIYTGTTFAGMVGLLTAQKPHGFTITLDERDQGDWWMNALEAIVAGTHGIAALHIRDAVASKDMDFESAVIFLADKPLIAPSYLIIGGMKPREGVVITRDRTAALDMWRLNAEHGLWYLVETNYDHWVPPPSDDNRRDPAIKAMNETTRAGLSPTSLFKVMSTPPVLNSGTTYTVVMSAALPGLYNTWIRNIENEY